MASKSMNKSSGTKSKARKDALQNLKTETANELGINLKQGYNGDITSEEAGRIGGGITRKVIEQMENELGR